MTLSLDSSIPDLAAGVQSGAVSAVELTRAALARIAEQRELNAFLHVSEQAALAAAERVDQRRASGDKLGALAGVPIAIKDALCTLDAPTTCASKILTRRGNDGQPTNPEHG